MHIPRKKNSKSEAHLHDLDLIKKIAKRRFQFFRVEKEQD